MNVKNPHLLVSLFTTSFVNKIIAFDHGLHLNGVLNHTGFSKYVRTSNTVETILTKVFDFLSENHRCEYVFKTAVLNEILLKHHSLVDATYLTEFRSYNALADVVILNGTSCVYEIKSDVDNLHRLNSQLSAYQKTFDMVFVVANKNISKQIEVIAPKSVGILNLNEDLSLSTIREGSSNIRFLDKSIMFDSLRKPEYVWIVKQVTGQTPKFPGTVMHAQCKKIFCRLSNKEAHSFFCQALKKRQLSKAQIDMVNNIQISIKCLLTDKSYSDKECENITRALNQKLWSI